MKAHRWFLLTGSLVALTACGVPIQSGSHFSRGLEPPRQATFAWEDEMDRTSGDSRLEANHFFHQKLHEAVEWELALRGVRFDATNPDWRIHHHLSLADHVFEQEVVDDSGASRIESDIYEGGSLVLHIENARTGEDVWVAWGQANVEPAFASPEAMQKWVYDLVGHMFDEWPVSPR